MTHPHLVGADTAGTDGFTTLLATAPEQRDVSDLVTRDDALVVKLVNAEQRTADFVASTDALDSHGDVVEQDWVLDHFKANPVILYGHNSRDLPIGQAIRVGVEMGALMVTIKFASAEANPMAEQVWRLVQERVLRAVSVGFKPTDGRYEMRDGREVFVWSSPVLKEISVVPVGANHEALARMKSALVAAHKTATTPAPVREDNNTPTGAKESHMDPKELLAKIDVLNAEKGAAEAQLKALTAERDAATKAAETAAKALAEAATKAETLTVEKAALESQNKALVTERDAAVAKAAEFEAKTMEQEVEALVGEKISADEVGTFIKLRKTNKELFDEMIAQRAPMHLTERVTPPDPKAKSGGGAITDLLAELNQS